MNALPMGWPAYRGHEMAEAGLIVERHPVPLSPDMRAELTSFWSSVFQISFAELDEVLVGAEADCNADTMFVACRGGELAATCHLTTSLADPRLGGLGEIATHPAHRGHGLAGLLVEQAIGEFAGRGGTHLVLGTVNPVAAKLYEKAGFRYLPDTRVMLRAADAISPDFADWFKAAPGAGLDIVPGGPRHRLPLIPLIVCATEDLLLDVNADLVSTRIAEQISCMGLYPRYHALGANGGHWFVAEGGDGVARGISSVRMAEGGIPVLDAFAHRDAPPGLLPDLFRRAIEWAWPQGPAIEAVCHPADMRKQAILAALGFVRDGTDTLAIAGRDYPVARLRLTGGARR